MSSRRFRARCWTYIVVTWRTQRRRARCARFCASLAVMAGSLVPCGGCQRHVRTSERSCPFCGEALALAEPVQELRLLTRLDRSAMVKLGAVLSAAGIVLGCHEPPVAIYGGPPVPPAPAPSGEPPAVLEPAPPASVAAPTPAPSSAASSAPAPSPAKPKSTATAKPANPPPGAPAAAYGAPPMINPGSSIVPSPSKPQP